MKVGITFDFEQLYLPTKRHKNPLKRKMVTCRDIDVHFIDEKDFPVAIRVTDFDVLSHNWEDQTESKYDTLEYRFDGKHLYEEPRSLSGSDKGELIFASEDAFMEHIRHHFCEKLYDYLYCYCEEKQYKEGVSVIVGDDIEDRVKRLQTFADKYLICNGKVWKKCGQPWEAIDDAIRDSDIKIHISDIDWDVNADDFDDEAEYDAVNENLPKEVEIPLSELEGNVEIEDYLSDNYDYCVKSFKTEEVAA